MSLIDNILMGFSITFEPFNIMVCFIGVLVGTLVGVLPGLGPAAAISLLLPTTFRLDVTSSIIMLAGLSSLPPELDEAAQVLGAVSEELSRRAASLLLWSPVWTGIRWLEKEGLGRHLG